MKRGTVSYINVWHLLNLNVSDDSRVVDLPATISTDETTFTITDGEELIAVRRVIELLDELDNGQAIVITVDNF